MRVSGSHRRQRDAQRRTETLPSLAAEHSGSEDDVTIYVYKMKHQERWAGGISDPMFNLTADTQDELHEFAARLGLPARDVSRVLWSARSKCRSPGIIP